MTEITSRSNEQLKLIKSLHNKKSRDQKKLFFVEGLRIVTEAIEEENRVYAVFYSESLAGINGGNELLTKLENSRLRIYRVSERLFREICDTETPQGVLAVVKMKECTMEEVLGKENPFLVILDSIQDPGNMGTIIRTADACGADGVVLAGGCVDAYNPKTLRSTMGSIFRIPIVKTGNLPELLGILKKKGIRSFAGHLKGERHHFDSDYTKPSALIIGNEANGIKEDALPFIDELVSIPMPGRAESLNASVAAGIMMYEVVRQRRQDLTR